ncbi:MAG: AAA family ATPase [Ignavibacteria bacterium]|nr:AAA family ATPase [Ignavibacteria bacterium]
MGYLDNIVKDKINVNPAKLFLYSHTKVGKTTLASKLPNALIIDTEDGSNFITGNVFNLREVLRNNPDKRHYNILYELANELKAVKQSGKLNIEYVVIDTVTALQDIAEDYATDMYKATALGKNFKGRSVLELPQGAGYYWLRKAFSNIYSWYEGIGKCLILLGHIKLASILKDGKELSARDIELVGKLKQIVTADCDAIGYLYRDKNEPNKVIVSFKTELQDLATGARPPHLRNQEFVISELMPDGNIVAHWDKIFINN